MRKTFLLLATLLIALPQPSSAQQFQGIEIFGGYSYMRTDLSSPFFFATAPTPAASNGNFTMNGWQASITEKATDWLGLTQEFGGNYGNKNFFGFDNHFSSFFILSGPRFYYPGLKGVTPFVHALFGYEQTEATVKGTTAKATSSSYAMAFGGGLDVKVTRGLAIRLFQVDYYRPQAFGSSQNDLRISTGIVFRFGGRR